jgi:hypothetical protein
MPAHTQRLRNFGNGIAPFGHLTHRFQLKLFIEIRFAYDGLPASNFGKKASTSLRAIQISADSLTLQQRSQKGVT